MKVRTNIKEIPLGSVATIIGYNKPYGGYIGKLTAFGLIPGQKLIVLKHITETNSIVMLLPEKILELSKPEADALCVKEIQQEEV